MKRLAAVLLVGVVAVPVGVASAQSASEHSDNMSLVGNWTVEDYAGSDLAFWGDMAVLGEYGGPGRLRAARHLQPGGARRASGGSTARGPQNDVSIWNDLVIVSVDSPRGATADDGGKPSSPSDCGAGGREPGPRSRPGTAWEGLRIVSIADPRQAGADRRRCKTDCGSHTHTLVPDPAHGRLIAYILSYPLGAPAPTCNVRARTARSRSSRSRSPTRRRRR